MTVRDQIKPGRRKRSPNGMQRDSKVWSVRGVEDSTISDAQLLSTLLDAPIGRVIDEAVSRLMQEIINETPQIKRKCTTLSNDYSWLLDKKSPPSGDPRVTDLENRLAQKRRDRDIIMGKKPS